MGEGEGVTLSIPYVSHFLCHPDPGQIVLITDRELKWALLPINNRGTFIGEPEGKRAQLPNKYS